MVLTVGLLHRPRKHVPFFELTGSDQSSAEQRAHARAVICQLAAGVTDILEIRYERPPYNLMILTHDDAPAGPKGDSTNAFFCRARGVLANDVLEIEEITWLAS